MGLRYLRRLGVWGTLALAVVCLSACATPLVPVAPPPTVWVPTQLHPATGTEPPCPSALITGELISDARFGMGLRESDGAIRMIIWPYGYAARWIGVQLELLDGAGTTIAMERDRVQIGGGETSDGSWLGCGGTTVLTRG